jgi:type IV fimbrial biogenesis protein FimT
LRGEKGVIGNIDIMLLKILGFTLIESLITLALIAILFAIIAPNFKHFFQQSNNQAIASQLMHAIQFARSQAIINNKKMMMCSSDNQKNCGGNWQQGFIIISDSRVLFSAKISIKNAILHWRSFPLSFDHLEFSSKNFQNGTFWLCPENAIYPSWAIVLNKSGRARIVYPNSVDEMEKLVC